MSDSLNTYIQLSKPFFTLKEIEFTQKANPDLYNNIKNFKSKSKDVFQALIKLIIKLKLPLRILQNSSYFYQKFYLLNNNYKKYSNLHFEVGLAVLFISLKLNDYIKKINVVLTEAFTIKDFHLATFDVEENKKIIISLERKILEFQSFDFRNFLIEDYLIKFMKHANLSIHLPWYLSNDLYLTSLVLQFPAHYNAIIALKCSTLLINELSKPQSIIKSPTPLPHIDINFKKTFSMIKTDSFVLTGVNQLLEYLIDNVNITFTKASLIESGFSFNDKQLIDLLINIKIDLNTQIIQTSTNNTILENDLFFKPRDTDIAKNGSLRFLYNKDKFMEELNV